MINDPISSAKCWYGLRCPFADGSVRRQSKCVNLGDLTDGNTVTMMSRGSGSSSGPLVQSRSAVVGVYIVGTIAGSVIAFASPSEIVGVECTPAAFQPEIDFCIETRQFAQPPLLVAASLLLLMVGTVAGGLAWRRWRQTVDWTVIDGVVDTPRAFRSRLRRRMALLVVAASPAFAGLATNGSTTSEFVQGERVCETRSFGTRDSDGVVPTVVACQQHSIETIRTEVRASEWSLPLLLVGLTLLAATTTWWVRAWRLERTLRKPRFAVVSLDPTRVLPR